MNYYEKMECDSNILGMEVATILPEKLEKPVLKIVLSTIRKEGYKLAYWKVNPNDSVANTAASDFSGFMAATKVTYNLDIAQIASNESLSNNIELFESDETSSELLSLVMKSGFYSSFIADTRFEPQHMADICHTKIAKSLNSEIDKKVFVYRSDDKIVGVITIEFHADKASIGIVAVDDNYRQKGIGKQLLAAAIGNAKLQGLKNIDIVTQITNNKACNFFEKNNFQKIVAANFYHFWM